ncbi:2Fe-2S iron-sulfur cluster-binding protein [Halioxenophilus sp. WMMB6]|uniref:2Fe-2S iron-sulfur cluster-binding protein n=1 Tax=Halioxenophilus sp. WMMB6 TaxID=3073815 RepID=UPI00295F0EDB|nr:2Fe-2S iron-sulfur cluster-binding protein [Halioxenophilus sp. WMMB6]
MVAIVVTDRNGNVQTLDAAPGYTLMEVIRDTGDLMALCGGMCSCATCHIYVDADFVDRLPPMSDDEVGLLEGTGYRRQSSRLSCQIPVTAEIDGLRVTVAPED